jgi:hypothetical protein
MKKISEYKDEEAIELLADLLDPVVLIFAEPDIAAFAQQKNYIKAVQIAIKKHKKEVMEIMAILEGVPVEEFHCNIVTLPKMLLSILNDPMLQDFFTSQVQTDSEIPSGPAMETTEVEENLDTSSII